MGDNRYNDKKVVQLRFQESDAKSAIQLLVAHIAREVNRQKLGYEQLKYIFACVRKKASIPVPRKPKRLFELPTDQEIDNFLSIAAKHDPIHRLIFEFLMGTGCRIDEACSLEVNRIDLTKNTIFIFQGKGQKDRVTILGTKLAQKLAIYLKGRNNRYLFESRRGTRYSTRRIQQICKIYKEESSITKRFSPHVWRHIWNSSLAANGLSEERRAIIAGHEKDSGAQQVYTHLSLADFKADVIAMLDKVSR